MARNDKAGEAPLYESDLRLEYTAAIIAQRVQNKQKLPLEVMLDVMDEYVRQNNHAAASAVADRAAPYVHPRLKDLVITGGSSDNPVRLEVAKSFKGLSDKEMELLERLLTKASGD
jgi:hypothetical protein